MTRPHRHHLLRWSLISLSLVACASPTSLEACDGARAVALPGDRCLTFMDRGALSAYRVRIEGIVTEALPQIDRELRVNGVEIRVLSDPRRVIPGLGFGGYAPADDRIELIFDPSFPTLPASVDRWLLEVVAHELHHVARRRSVGYGATLLEAAVSEGLADHFSLQVAGGAPPPWSVALSDAELAIWTATARQTWSDPGYDHARWFFGDHEVPRWTGYALGYAWVGDYLARDPARTAAGLVDEPAARFTPGG